MLTRILEKLNSYEVAGDGQRITEKNLLSLEFYFDYEDSAEMCIVWFRGDFPVDKIIVEVDDI